MIELGLVDSESEKASSKESKRSKLLDQIKQKHKIRKVLVAGSGAVGKTSLVRVLKESKSLEEISQENLEYHRTLFIDMEVVSASSLVTENAEGVIQVVDIAGQLDLPIHAIRDARRVALGSVDVILLVFASDNLQSLLDLNEWLELLYSYYRTESQEEEPEFVLIRNKSDLRNTVDSGLIEALLEGNSSIHSYFETSCMNGDGIQDLRTWFYERFFSTKRELVPPDTTPSTPMTGTGFRCMICGESMSLDIDNEVTYDSKTSHDKFFGMQLTTYRVSHYTSDERHQNLVLIDHRGLFRGHKDAFSEPITQEVVVNTKQFRLISPELPALLDHKQIEIVLIFDRTDNWLMNFLCPSEVRPSELVMLLQERILESEQIYEELPDYTIVKVADREIHIWMNGPRVVAVQVSNPEILTQLTIFAKELIKDLSVQGSKKQQSILLSLRILNETPSIESKVISRLLSDDLLYSETRLEIQDRIPRIVERVSKEYPIANEILTPLLQGDVTLMELLDDGYSRRIDEVFDLIDYVNRRGLFG